MSFVYPLLRHPACMVKDVGRRLVKMSHYLLNVRYEYPVCRHQNISVYRNVMPITEDAAFIAPNAAIVGNVIFGNNSSAMYHACIRNYHSSIPTRIGDGTSVLENVTFMGQCKIGNNCVIGIGSSLDCCTLHENVIIGSGCSIALGATIEQGAIIAAGSAVYRDVRVPANELWAGIPAQKVCDVDDGQRATATHLIKKHIKHAQQHRIAIQDHYAESATYDYAWLQKMCQQIESHQTTVAFPDEGIKVPLEAKRFLTPRINMRLPAMHARVSYPVNRIAPHMYRPPDAVGNA